MGRSTRTILLSLALVFVAGSSLAAADGVTVELNDSKRIGLYGSAANVIIGDPSVADVTMVDSHSLIVVGKGYGRTHVMVMDGTGRTLLDTRVTVVAPEDGRMTLYRGAAASEFSCSPRCQSVGSAANAAASSPVAPTPAQSASQ